MDIKVFQNYKKYWSYIAIFLGLLVLLFLRFSDFFINPQFEVEDGTIYFKQCFEKKPSFLKTSSFTL